MSYTSGQCQPYLLSPQRNGAVEPTGTILWLTRNTFSNEDKCPKPVSFPPQFWRVMLRARIETLWINVCGWFPVCENSCLCFGISYPLYCEIIARYFPIPLSPLCLSQYPFDGNPDYCQKPSPPLPLPKSVTARYIIGAINSVFLQNSESFCFSRTDSSAPAHLFDCDTELRIIILYSFNRISMLRQGW